LKSFGSRSLREHLEAHPEFVQEAVGLIEVTDVNQASLRLFEADRKEQLLGPLDFVLDAVSQAALSDTILAIDEEKSDVKADSTAVTLKGRRLSLLVKTHIPAAHAAYPHMIVSLIDLTARREAEERYRSLMEQAADGIVVIDEEGKFVNVNPALCDMLGYDRETLLRMNLLDTYPGEMRTTGTQRIDQLKAGQALRFERPMRKKDGSLIFVEVSARRLQNGAMQGIMHDITRRRETEAALATERGFFRILMERLPDYIYFKDSGSRFMRTSQAHARVLGLRDPSEAVGKTDADFYGADHAKKAFEDEQHILRTGEPLLNIEERETYPGRPDTWAITSKIPLRNSQGEIIGTFGITHDITERKQVEAKNQQLAALVESAEDAIVGIDLERRITVWNKGAERLYGYSAQEMIGSATSSLIPPELEDEARLMRERLMRGEQITHFETTRLRKGGSRITVSLTLAAVRDSDGRFMGMASVARDITAQKALQVQLNRAQRLESLATLAGGVAHQFNNINTIVRGYLEMMQAEKELPARVATCVEAACAGVQRAVDITDHLLALTEPAGPSRTLRLDVLARALLPLHEKRMEKEQVRLALDLVETPMVQGDEVRVKFVFSSLIVNALDSLLDRPVRLVSVRTGRAKDACYFEVEDTGCGIPEEDLPRIFSPFFSAKGEWAPPGSPQARLKGVGLSLAISSSTVSEYGGRIDVKSTKGTGSTFKVLLPLAGLDPLPPG
jgi:PAS domain S-box-containing protein